MIKSCLRLSWIITFTLLLIFLLMGCGLNKIKDCADSTTCNAILEPEHKLENNPNAIIVDKIEVYHFHGANQCFSCRTIKEFAEKTVNTYYSDLLESGKMEFKSINGELPENLEVTAKYGATGSSLWIGTYINGEFHKEQNTNVWYKVNDEKDFLSYLKGVLDKRVAGNLS